MPLYNAQAAAPLAIFFCLLLSSCSQSNDKKEAELYNTYCASCHVTPKINHLPKSIWAQHILPEMGARLGIRDEGYDPYKDLSFNEQSLIMQSGIFPSRPLLDLSDWETLKAYIIREAPESLDLPQNIPLPELTQFSPKPLVIDSIKRSKITFLEYKEEDQRLLAGSLSGNLTSYNLIEEVASPVGRFGRGITGYSRDTDFSVITTIGNLAPSEIPLGRIFFRHRDSTTLLPDILHRPVHTSVADLNKDGIEELVVCEYGDLRGMVSLFYKNKKGLYEKKELLPVAGAIKTEIRDMNADGMPDLVLLTAQGDEGITIMYQEQDLEFRAERVIRFSPLYGSSWFEIVDYEGDGDLDLVTVHGDNADKSNVLKPYHGMRLHINKGDSVYEEKFFYPMYGATRVTVSDFDADGDLDFGLLSTFPDFDSRPLQSFVYLENRSPEAFEFLASSPRDLEAGRWFLMDKGDVDLDGDTDIILSSFSLMFTPAPPDLMEIWNNSNVSIMLLENTLNKVLP